MFLKKNQNLLLGTTAILIAWLIVYYVFISDNWKNAADAIDQAHSNRTAWEHTARNDSDAKAAAERKNEYLPKAKALQQLNINKCEIMTKLGEKIPDAVWNSIPRDDQERIREDKERVMPLHAIEFGDRESLKDFSILAAGKGGDPQNLFSDKRKQGVLRAAALFPKAPIEAEQLAATAELSQSDVSVNLLRMALIDRFLSACKEAHIDTVVQIKHFEPKYIEAPKVEKSEDDTAVKKSRYDRDKEKDKDADKGFEVERLAQFPIKALVRAPEKYIGELLYELEKPTPKTQEDGNRRGYFCVRGFHVSVKDGLVGAVEMSVGLSALLPESEVKALGIKIKEEGRVDRERFDDAGPRDKY